MTDDDTEYYTMRSHSLWSVALAFIIFIGVIYGVTRLVDLFRAGNLNLAYISSNFRTCDSNAGKPNPPAPPIKPFKWENTGLITLWFDDGWKSQYTEAFPILQKEQMVGAIAVATGFVCKGMFVTWDNLRTMQDAGWETTAHSVNHFCDLSYYNAKTIVYELEGSKQALEKHGLHADQFVMPCGYNKVDLEEIFGSEDAPPIVDESKKYFTSYRTTKTRRLNTLPVVYPYNYNLYALQILNTTSLKEIQNAIDTAKQKKAWLILVFHYIDTTNTTFSITPSELQKILLIVKASGLPVVLPSQALSIKTNSQNQSIGQPTSHHYR